MDEQKPIEFSNYKSLARALGIGTDTMQRLAKCDGFPAKPWRPEVVGDFILNRCPRVANSTRRQVAASLGLSLAGENAIDSEDAELYLGSNSPNLERLRKYKADLEHLKLQEARGELVRLEDYQTQERERHAIARGILLRLKETLPLKVLNRTEEELREIIGREIDNVCRAIAEGLNEAASMGKDEEPREDDKPKDTQTQSGTSEA